MRRNLIAPVLAVAGLSASTASVVALSNVDLREGILDLVLGGPAPASLTVQEEIIAPEPARTVSRAKPGNLDDEASSNFVASSDHSGRTDSSYHNFRRDISRLDEIVDSSTRLEAAIDTYWPVAQSMKAAGKDEMPDGVYLILVNKSLSAVGVSQTLTSSGGYVITFDDVESGVRKAAHRSLGYDGEPMKLEVIEQDPERTGEYDHTGKGLQEWFYTERNFQNDDVVGTVYRVTRTSLTRDHNGEITKKRLGSVVEYDVKEISVLDK
jgi:hypothetical protein